MATIRQIAGANNGVITLAVIPNAVGTAGDAQLVGITDGTNTAAVDASGNLKITAQTPPPGYAAVYPSNAARGGAVTLVGAGSTSDVFTFAATQNSVLVYNGTAATIYAYPGSGSSSGVSATQGDVPIAAGSGLSFNAKTDFVALYGAASTHVNGTVASAIVVRGGA